MPTLLTRPAASSSCTILRTTAGDAPVASCSCLMVKLPRGIAERIFGITGRIDLVHANDSKDGAGSGRDRHEHLGAGQIDADVLVEVVRTAAAPVVCETALDGVKDDIAFLRDRL